MRKTLILNILFLVGMTANAQKIQFGIRGGLNVSKESNHNFNVANYGPIEFGTYFRPGLNIGGLINFPTGHKFSTEIGVSYSMLGYRDKIFEDASSNEYFYAKVRSHYLIVPIVENFYLFGSSFYIELGTQLGILLSKKTSMNNDVGYISFDGNNKTMDCAVLGGLGYRFTNHIFLDIRYLHGLTETCRLYEGGKTRNIQFSLGYLF